MNISSLEELKQQLLADKITPEKAAELIYSSSSMKSWQRTEWKDRRELLLKDSCEQCSSTKPPLVLQHTWHPRSYKTIKYALVAKYGDLINDSYPVDMLVTEQEVLDSFESIEKTERDVCSKCFSYNIKARKTKSPEYICGYCKHEMDQHELTKKVVPFFVDNRKEDYPKQHRNTVTYSSIAWEIYKDKAKNLLFEIYGKQIEKETLLIVIDDSIRYQRLEDVITFCKKCAFLYDVKKKNLCPTCKSNYKNIGATTCYDCNHRSSLENTVK